MEEQNKTFDKYLDVSEGRVLLLEASSNRMKDKKFKRKKCVDDFE
jgi:hypothetical protein